MRKPLSYKSYISALAVLGFICHGAIVMPAFSQIPVLNYHFDGDYQDSSSSTNHGVASGSASITTTSNDVAFGSGALSLDGTSGGYVDLGTPIVFSDSQPWSALFWAKRASLGSNKAMIMGDRANNNDFIWLNDSFNGLRFRSTSNNTLDFTVPQNLSYHHYALVANGSGDLTLYRNGTFQQTLSDNTSFKITTIGNAYSSDSYILNGELDEVHIYTNALTSNQVYTTYTNEYTEYTEPIPLPVVNVLRVFLQGGQSNSDGRASPSGQATYSDIDFYSDTSTRAGTLTDLYAGASATSAFGPELTFGRRLSDILGCNSSNRLAIIKYANGGTSLHSQWKGGGNATTTGDGSEYIAFQQAVSDGLSALAAKYTNAAINIEGMIWMQGESDATVSQSTNYYDNLTNFISDVRATYGARLPFVIGRLSTNQTGAAAQLIQGVQDGQSAAAAESTLNGLVYTDTFPLQDKWHFNVEGQLGLGKAFASEMAYILWITSQLTPQAIDAGDGEPLADPDMDGIVNSDEFIAGSSATNSSSKFFVSIATSGSNTFEINHPSHIGRQYQLESCSNLINRSWITNTAHTGGNSGGLTHTVTNIQQETFFRVRADLP